GGSTLGFPAKLGSALVQPGMAADRKPATRRLLLAAIKLLAKKYTDPGWDGSKDQPQSQHDNFSEQTAARAHPIKLTLRERP
ncbi:hypothetical protein E2562_026845, partial [Oryza meyeriana var. granulata]